jgi:hypothetical protein
MKYVFRFFEPLRRILALKLAKSGNISKKYIVKKIDISIKILKVLCSKALKKVQK